MIAISLWQPWASLWLSPAKIHETRHWPARHRGWLLVHAAKRLERDVDDDLHAICRDQFGPLWRTSLPRGSVIGAVDLIDCKSTESVVLSTMDAPEGARDIACGNFDVGRFAWRRGAYKRFATPIPYRGLQSFFDVPDALVDASLVDARLEAA